MKTSFRILRLAVALAGGAVIATAAEAAGTPLFVGDPGDEASVQRVITIKPDAKWVNVTEDETVKFVDAATGKSFVWHFDTGRATVFDLATVAPADVLGGHHLAAYVAQSRFDNDD
jgi:hypothetical protein